MKLCQEARLWGIAITDNFVTFTFLDEFKDCELLALSQHRLRVSQSFRQSRDTKVEMRAPAQAKRNFLLHLGLTVVHIYITYLQVGAHSSLPEAVESAG